MSGSDLGDLKIAAGNGGAGPASHPTSAATISSTAGNEGAGLATHTTTAAASAPTSNSGNGIDTGESKQLVSFSPPNDRVFVAQHKTPQNISYSTQDQSIIFKRVTWLARKTVDDQFEELCRAEFSSNDNAAANPERPFGAVGYTNATLEVGDFYYNGSALTDYYSQEMVLQIDWETLYAAGYTQSGVFTVAGTEGDRNAAEGNLGNAIQKDGHLDKGIESTTQSWNSPSATSGVVSPTSPSGGKSKGGGGGLSTGATAGIAVGAVLGGLLLIGALLWFFLRRRRQNKNLKSGYNGQQTSNTYMVDKETHGRVTESPTTPFTEDQHQRVPLNDIAPTRERGAPTSHADQPGFAPYEDAPPRSSLGSHNSRPTGSQTPQGMSANVAHLVEEGMTADEIRRLEEEERQLDDEIERAGRR